MVNYINGGIHYVSNSIKKRFNCKLGLIADDIQDEQLFKFVGAATEDDEGETCLGLKPIPLAVLALSACKNLLQRVKQLESK